MTHPCAAVAKEEGKEGLGEGPKEGTAEDEVGEKHGGAFQGTVLELGREKKERDRIRGLNFP
jgi:hypothetical protein